MTPIFPAEIVEYNWESRTFKLRYLDMTIEYPMQYYVDGDNFPVEDQLASAARDIYMRHLHHNAPMYKHKWPKEGFTVIPKPS